MTKYILVTIEDDLFPMKKFPKNFATIKAQIAHNQKIFVCIRKRNNKMKDLNYQERAKHIHQKSNF